MPRKSQHIEKLSRLLFYVRKDDFRTRAASGVDDAEQDRNPDAVDDLGTREIYYELSAPFVQPKLAFALYLFTGELVEVVAREHNGAFIIRFNGFCF